MLGGNNQTAERGQQTLMHTTVICRCRASVGHAGYPSLKCRCVSHCSTAISAAILSVADILPTNSAAAPPILVHVRPFVNWCLLFRRCMGGASCFGDHPGRGFLSVGIHFCNGLAADVAGNSEPILYNLLSFLHTRGLFAADFGDPMRHQHWPHWFVLNAMRRRTHHLDWHPYWNLVDWMHPSAQFPTTTCAKHKPTATNLIGAFGSCTCFGGWVHPWAHVTLITVALLCEHPTKTLPCTLR